MQAVQERVCDQSVLKLLRVMLRAGVMQDGQVRRPVTGTPQGGGISPLLCNVYLHRLDRVWDVREHGVLVRFADDALVMCKSRAQAEAALSRLRELLADLGLEPKEAKTRIVHLEVGGQGLTFLGFAHHLVRSPARSGKQPITFLARWPADKAMQHARDRLRELTDRSRLRVPVELVVQEMNWFLNGWAAYFKYGNSARRFSQLQWYARMRLGLFLSKRHRRGRRFGRWLVGVRAPARLRLAGLDGIVVAPRPNRSWRERSNAGGERRR
jgi:RNA-directed DNA polymerase